MLAKISAPVWSARITTEHAKLLGKYREYCTRLYLDMARTLKYYGSSVFPVQYKQVPMWSTLPPKFDVFINTGGIVFLERESRVRPRLSSIVSPPPQSAYARALSLFRRS